MLIKTIDQLRTIIPRFPKNYGYDNISPAINQAERKYLVPFIGQNFYDELVAITSPTATQTEVIYRLSCASAYYARLDNLSEMSIQIGDAGVAIATSQNTTPLTQWKEYSIKSGDLDKAETSLELALEYLELKADDFPTWKASDEYTISKQLFLNTAKALSEFVPFANSRRAYLSLRPFIKEVERKVIVPTIGQDLFDELKEAIKDNSLSEDQTKLLPYIQSPLANLAAKKGFTQLAIAYNGRGFRLISENDGMVQKQAITADKLNTLSAELAAEADIALIALKRYLQDNADTFTAYKESDSYVTEEEAQPQNFPTNTGGGSFMV